MSQNIYYNGNGNSLEQLLDISRSLDARKRDVVAPMTDITYAPDSCAMVVKESSNLFGEVYTAATLEKVALSQICDRLVAPPVKYMRECPPRLRAENLNHWQQHHASNKRKSDWLVRVDDGDPDGGSSVRAVLTERYTPVGNSDLIEIVQEITQGLNYDLVRSYVTRDQVLLKIRVAERSDTDDYGGYGFGLYLKSDEIGRSSIHVSPFIQRNSCTNSIVPVEGGVSLRHTRRGDNTQAHLSVLRTTIKAHAGEILRISSATIDKALEAERKLIPSVADVLRDLCKDNSWGEHVLETALQHTEGNVSPMGVVHGLSAAAHRIKDASDELRDEIEIAAGNYLHKIDLDSLDDISRLFAVGESVVTR